MLNGNRMADFATVPPVGSNVPKVDAASAIERYQAYAEAIEKRLVASAIAVNLGGIGAALAKSAIGGLLGAKVNLAAIPGAKNFTRNDTLLFSESQSRLLVSVAPQHAAAFEAIFSGQFCAAIGEVSDSGVVQFTGINGTSAGEVSVTVLEASYKARFANY
jgi:phosphoribosylformylglycinamidine synthase